MTASLAGNATQPNNAAVVAYDTYVKQVAQGKARLKPTVTVKTGVIGDSYNFRTFSKQMAVQHTSSELLTPGSGAHTKIPAQLYNYRVGAYTDLFDQAETTVDERQTLAEADVLAIGRAEDQLIINALVAAAAVSGANAFAGSVAVSVGGSNSGINSAKLIRAKRLLTAQNADSASHNMVINAIGMESALSETQVTSSDYQTMRALANKGGTLQGESAFGFVWTVMDDRAEGGLPLAASQTRQCFAYDKSCIGLAEGLAPETYVDWIPERTSWLSQAILRAGAAVIDGKGVVSVLAYEPST